MATTRSGLSLLPASPSIESRSVPDSPALMVSSGEERTELDLGADARLFPIEPSDPAPTLSSRGGRERCRGLPSPRVC